MKGWVKTLFFCLFLCGVATGMGLAVAASGRERSMKTCNALEVVFEDGFTFLSEGDVEEWIGDGYGRYVGERIDSVSLSEVERVLNSKSAVRSSQAWITGDGVLHVSVKQRKPLLKIDNGRKGYYLDGDLVRISPSPGYTADVPVFEGDIPESEDWRRSLISMVRTITEQQYWPGFMNGFKVDVNGDITISVSDGPEVFLFGQPSEVSDKLDRMKTYCRTIRPLGGHDAYRTVSVKYDRQIICGKQ